MHSFLYFVYIILSYLLLFLNIFFHLKGLYKSDERFGPGIETYPDNRQDVGLWHRHHIIKLCTQIPEHFTLFDFPELSIYFDAESKQQYISEESTSIWDLNEEKDPFFYRFKRLLLNDDNYTLPADMYIYSVDADNLPLTQSFLKEFDFQYFKKRKHYASEKPWCITNITPILVKMQKNIYKYRHCQSDIDWNINAIIKGSRHGFRAKGPKELIAEELIEKSAEGNYKRVYEILRENLAHPDIADMSGYTALSAAALNYQEDIINLLLDFGADVNKCSDEGLSTLSMCVINYFPAEGFQPNIVERNIFSKEVSVLTWVFFLLDFRQKKRMSIIKMLLRRGADPNISNIPMHVLFFAVKSADAEVVQILLEAGARTDIRLPTRVGYFHLFSQLGGVAPLHIAAALSGVEGIVITELLLHAAADPDVRAQDEDDIFRLDKVPVKFDVGESVSFIKMNNEPGPPKGYYRECNIVPEEGGRTPLHIACEREDNFMNTGKVIHHLLDHNANPNVLWNGHSPLSLAVACGNEQAVAELLAGGAEPNLPLSQSIASALCAVINPVYEQTGTIAAKIALIETLIAAGADMLMPITLIDESRTAVGTVVDYAYFKYYQRDTYAFRRKMLDFLSERLRDCVTEKEKQWDEEEFRKIKIGPLPEIDPSKSLFFKYCYQCGRSVGVILTPCQHCFEIFTCSKSCKVKAWNERHKRECLQTGRWG
ncbi:hypothetical protein E2320_008896 [Naja naja]|nr:hypothetical protein E2320_008896 [Naja naja]